MNQSIDIGHVKTLVGTSLTTGDTSSCGSCEVVRRRSGKRGMMMRVTDAGGGSVIAKAWRIRKPREYLKSLVGLSMAHREWRAHRHVERCGLGVPKLLSFLKLRCDSGYRYEVLVVEDLGRTRNGLVYLKGLLAAGDDESVHRFESRVIEMTGRLLDAGIIDIDHQLRNIVLNGTDRPIRIDFECARRFRTRIPQISEYGRMIGRLVVSHAYACQPDLARTECFARRLSEYLHPPRPVLDVAQAQIAHELARQCETAGIDSRLNLNW